MKKGQALTEFLMTYGWAILVVIACIGALAYFGVFSPNNFTPTSCLDICKNHSFQDSLGVDKINGINRVDTCLCGNWTPEKIFREVKIK